MSRYVTLVFIFVASLLNAVTHECATIKDLLNYADPGTLVVTDLNNVLIRTAQSLGSDEWAAHEVSRRMQETAASKREVLNDFVPLWHHIRMRSEWLCCEAIAPDIVRRLQQDGIQVLGLTAQFTELAYPTHKQLRKLGIDLAAHSVHPTDVEVLGGAAAKYIEGIVFVGLDNDKGETLMRLLNQVQCTPKRIVFIDDKAKNVASVEAAVQARGIDFVGLRYSAMDHLAAEFDPAIAALQAQYCAGILPNHVAQALRGN